MHERTINLIQVISALGLMFLFCSCQSNSDSTNGKRVRISAKLPGGKIREEILKYTPIGMSEDEVMKFAQMQLEHGKNEPGKRDPSTIMLLLGHYGFTLMGSKNTFILWRFDANHRLTDVDVRFEHDGTF